MAILIGQETRILLQGITGTTGRALAQRWVAHGGPLVAGVAPAGRAPSVAGVPVVGSCSDAVRDFGVNASFVAVPAPAALDAALEALEAGIHTVVVYAEGVPVRDALVLYGAARRWGAAVLGPNAAGCISPGFGNLSDLNEGFVKPGRIGIVSKSGTLTYEVITLLEAAGLGQSTVVCLGGDRITCTGQADILPRFEADDGTDAVVLLGEIGGGSEYAAAAVVQTMKKPVIAYIAGRHAPPGRPMGHAGALLSSAREAADSKSRALQDAGATVVTSVLEVGFELRRRLAEESAASCTE